MIACKMSSIFQQVSAFESISVSYNLLAISLTLTLNIQGRR